MKNNEISFDTDFKEGLVDFLTVSFNACGHFTSSIEDCETYGELKVVLKRHSDDVMESLDYERITELSSDNDEKDEEITKLEENVDKLEAKIESLEIDFLQETQGNLHVTEKIEIFREYMNKYTPWELEELLKNGK